MTKWFISIKPSMCVHLTTIYSRCWTNCLVYVFSTPEEPSTQIYRLWGDPQAGNVRLLRGAQCTGQVSGLPPVEAWRTSARSLPGLCQKHCEPAACSFELLALGFPTLNSFSSELISNFFFLMLSSLGGTKKKLESGERPRWKVPEGKGG